MNRQQTHRVRIDCRRRLKAASFKRAHKSVRSGIAPAVKLQGYAEQGAQIGKHSAAAGGRRCGCKPCQHVAVLVDCLQRIMRRQAVHPALIFSQSSRQPNVFGYK